MVITVQITPNGKVTEMSSEEADKQKGERIYSGAALDVPDHWEHKRYRLTMTMLDTLDFDDDPCGDELNVLATTIYRHTRSDNYMPNDMIFGTVYIGNETATEIIDFTKEDLAYICKQVFKPQIP
jgi:hypothetical protein